MQTYTNRQLRHAALLLRTNAWLAQVTAALPRAVEHTLAELDTREPDYGDDAEGEHMHRAAVDAFALAIERASAAQCDPRIVAMYSAAARALHAAQIADAIDGA